MKMLLLIFRESMEREVHDLLQKLNVKAFTETPTVLGAGETGTVLNSFERPGCNSMILAAMEDEKAGRVLERLKAFCEGLTERQHGMKIPLRVFTFPCDSVI